MLKPEDKIRILVADKVDLAGLSLLNENHFSADIKFGIPNSKILNSGIAYDVLVIRSTRKINNKFLKKCSFKIIATCTKGIDHIDLEAAKKSKIKIINSEQGNSVSAAEHTFALILSIFKNILLSDKLVRKNKFSFYDYRRAELKGKKIGIIGLGKVGSRVAMYAKAFQMKIMANDIDKKIVRKYRKFSFVDLDYLLENADIITVHIPLNSDNKNFISREKLKLINENAVIINTSRGGVIDENYLLKMLKNRKIFYAGLDVFRNEPAVNAEFFNLDNVLLTNHIAGKTKDSSKYISKDIFMQVKKHFSLKTKKC
ncbi:MAG: hypothetical protein HY959_09850 [Ignavibacteriae bacterium]|nr:hypothetical protein [Ignavibacteriota bacterium]